MRLSANQQVEPHPFAQDNIVFLQQGVRLLTDLSDAEYVRTFPPSFVSPIGTHIRHILDHYACFLSCLANGRIDYDNRTRDVRTESERIVAIDALKKTIASLAAISEEDRYREIAVQMDCGGGPAEAGIWARSSVDRELQFLVSHTVHHYALVAIMLRLEGREPVEGFGVSPSTMKFWKSLQ